MKRRNLFPAFFFVQRIIVWYNDDCAISEIGRNSSKEVIFMKKKDIQKLTGMAVLTAIIIILQIAGGGIHVGPVSISLVLIPIVTGAVLYGPLAGMILGAVFGIVVLIMIFLGMDPASMAMMQFNAGATIITCLVKGMLAGLIAGLLNKAIAKRGSNLSGTIAASIITPVINTGFYVCMVTFIFRELMEKSYKVHGTAAVFLLITGMIAANFVMELISTAVISPIVITALRKVIGSRKND